MDVVAGLALPVPATIICEMLGIPIADRDRFTSWTAEATHGLAGDLPPPVMQQRALAAASRSAAYFERLIEERRGDTSATTSSRR